MKAAEERAQVAGTWRDASLIGDYYLRRRDNQNAFAWYEKSLSLLKSHPAVTASLPEKQALLDKAGAAKSGTNAGSLNAEGKWIPSTRDLDGGLGGLYSAGLSREVEVLSVPLPIRFYTNQTRFTPEGEAAVRELADAVKEQKVARMKLVGHADPRGAPQYNMELSRGRVEAVRDWLLRAQVRARIDIEWKGATQPFDINVLPYKPTQEEAWAFDRRVEWMRGGDAD